MHTQSVSSNICTTVVRADVEGRAYRFVLKRIWEPKLEIGAFLCKNPSKADHLRLDDTVFKCGNLAVQWGWGGYYILNLYPNYSTDPRDMIRTSATNLENAKHIETVFSTVRIIVLACGNGYSDRLKELISGVPHDKLFCLQKNKGNGFLHPSRIQPEDFPHPVKVGPRCA